MLYLSKFDLVKEGLKVERKQQGVWEALAEAGGFAEMLYFIFYILMFPFAQHGFMLSSIKKLFLAKTQEPQVFKGGQNSYKKEYKKGIHNYATPKSSQAKEAQKEPVYAIITLSNLQKI